VQPDIEAVMITAFETTDTIRQALRLRAADYINKPFDIATIRTAVNGAMQRRMLESEIHTSAEKVNELLAELQNQKVEEQIARTRGEIYASIIHDINGPLTVVCGFVQLLNKRLNRMTRLEVEDLQFIRERLGIVERQIGNCIEISRRYLGFLRHQTDEIQPTGVQQLLNDLEQLVRVHPGRGAGHNRLCEDQRDGRDPNFAQPGGQRVPVHAAAASRNRGCGDYADAAGTHNVQGRSE